MQNPLQVTFHDMHHEGEVERLILEKYEKIKSENPNVTKCHVVLEKQSKHHKKGNEAYVRMDLKISHFEDIVISEKCLEDKASLKNAVIAVFKQGLDLAREQKKHRAEIKRIPVELRAVEPVDVAEE